ncbi:U-box domain-containing protein 43 isoform X1 [Amborella trichopoda]|nr:U-box domain-containing protein 43 isoform X1 [Amborella trichopoda]|eukprot:XP_006843588.2 U-box domain-containing protein 43 isoform X1 [Amborella trichopoda]
MLSTSAIPSIMASIEASLSEICSFNYAWECPLCFCSYSKRLELIVKQLQKSQIDPIPSFQNALKGISEDLSKACKSFAAYRGKGKIYVLVNCLDLCLALQERCRSIGAWLTLIEASCGSGTDLKKKTHDLSEEMQQAQFKVTDNEERVYYILQKEAQGRQTTKAVQSAILMDLARALGTGPENHHELAEHIQIFKTDLGDSMTGNERRILVSLERMFGNWSIEPKTVSESLELEFEEEGHIPPFKNFLCPLTKEVMKDPVVLESSQTYERSAIRYWFDLCVEDGRDPTCPVTGKVLKSLDQKPNIGLAGAIEEWVNRNVEIQIQSATENLSEESTVECIERTLNNIYRTSEEHPLSRYRLRKGGIIHLIIALLKSASKNIGSHLRIKALMTMHSLSKEDECKKIMLQEGMARLAIRSLTGNLEKEKEYALKLLSEFSCDEDYRRKIASEKGALVLLTTMAGNLEHPALANLAEMTLQNLEKVEENVPQLAAAGRFQPLLVRLCEGTEDVKIAMASVVGTMTLANNGKEHVARQGSKVLIRMLSSKPDARISSLQALYNLSGLDDNATILVDAGVLPPLIDILFKEHKAVNSTFTDVQDLASATLAHVVMKAGHWELASVDRDRHSMQSEFIIHGLLRLISDVSPNCQLNLLQILYGIASSPQAAESAATSIKSGNGISIITPFLEHQEIEHRISAFRLISILSRRLGQALSDELRGTNKLALLKNTLVDSNNTTEESSEAAYILSNLTISDDEVKTVLGTSLIRWIISRLKDQKRSASGRGSRPSSNMAEGLMGLLLHFTKSTDPSILDAIQENRLMGVLLGYVSVSPNPRVKKRATIGLMHLSQSLRARGMAKDSEPQPPSGLCSSLMFICGKPPLVAPPCLVHYASCEEDSQFCLLKANAIKPLVEILGDEDTSVQIAAVEALSTLLSNQDTLKGAVDVLDKYGVLEAVIDLFVEVRPGELQEKVVWMVDKIIRVDHYAQSYSVDQRLVKALVEALKYGNATTKRLAQEVLTNLKQLSGVGGRNSNQSQGRRDYR